MVNMTIGSPQGIFKSHRKFKHIIEFVTFHGPDIPDVFLIFNERFKFPFEC